MKLTPLFAAAFAAIAFSGTAHAGLLDSKTITYQYYFPNLSTPYSAASNGNWVVGAGIEVNNVSNNRATLDLYGSTIYVDFTTNSAWSPAAFQGFKITDSFGTIDAFTGVTINAGSNLAGFDASRITFDEDHIWVNWQGLSYKPDTVLSLNIESPAAVAVPEPASAALVLLGLAGGGVARRPRQA
jgi:hypothetical protein